MAGVPPTIVSVSYTHLDVYKRQASGIPRTQEAMREANLPEPEFHTEGMFTAVFKRQISNSANYDTVNGLSLIHISYCIRDNPLKEKELCAET